jgi:hypothetical protein
VVVVENTHQELPVLVELVVVVMVLPITELLVLEL